jgi:GT2 family glycosyltransferase
LESIYLIILVNYNNWKDTLECIDSLKKSGIKDSSMLIVENCSKNDSLQKLRTAEPDIKIMNTKENLGFTGGNNLGIKYAIENKFKYAILLNNDTIVESANTINLLIDEMEKNEAVTLGTGRIFYFPEKDRIWYDGGKMIKWRGMAIHNNYRKKIEEINLSNQIKYIDFISGCFMCIRLSDISKLGLLNDNFFMYLDDIEYSARAAERNLKLLFIPQVVIFHKAMGEGERTPKLVYYSLRNRKILINLHFGIVAKLYFEIVLIIKRVLWFFTNKKYYNLLLYAVRDYKKQYYGQAPEYIK